mmetsp:Transcript_88788/g.229014  ORF Transcript_88788/g.229014 Transcript_88788/m.229014 type:complete len:203 (+) Transcript_88788:520-1128(+)
MPARQGSTLLCLRLALLMQLLDEALVRLRAQERRRLGLPLAAEVAHRLLTAAAERDLLADVVGGRPLGVERRRLRITGRLIVAPALLRGHGQLDVDARRLQVQVAGVQVLVEVGVAARVPAARGQHGRDAVHRVIVVVVPASGHAVAPGFGVGVASGDRGGEVEERHALVRPAPGPELARSAVALLSRSLDSQATAHLSPRV